MPTIDELLNSGTKPPLGAQLAEGIRVLSADQQIHFDLYQKYVFTLDGMVYWIKGSNANIPQKFNVMLMKGGMSQQVVDGNINAQFISGGEIINPLDASDQGLTVAEPIFVDPTGPADSFVSGTTVKILPGQSYIIPPFPENGVWVSALTGGHQITVMLLGTQTISDLPLSVEVKGSLHYAAMTEQVEDATITINDIIFTSLSEVQLFNVVGPDQLYIATYRGIQFAFSSRSPYYQQADLYHYVGQAVKSTHGTQIIDDLTIFVPDLTISNSLPLWLYLNGYVPPYRGFRCPFRLYPSYLVEDNIPPPFGAVHIESTESLVEGPTFGVHLEQEQLCQDSVRITTYGAPNHMIQSFLAFILQYSLDWNRLGMSNMPVVSDEKKIQAEFQILAKKKVIEFEVNYLQSQVRDITRKLITSAMCQLYTPLSVQPIGK